MGVEEKIRVRKFRKEVGWDFRGVFCFKVVVLLKGIFMNSL